MTESRISQHNPPPGVSFAELLFPDNRDAGTGVYRFAVQPDILSKTGHATISFFNVPVFAVRVDISLVTREVVVLVGKADSTPPAWAIFLLPEDTELAASHSFEVKFEGWAIKEFLMDENALQRQTLRESKALDAQEGIFLAPAFKGAISAGDLLRPQRSFWFEMMKDDIKSQDGYLFRLAEGEFRFNLRFEGGNIVLERCSDQIVLSPDLDFEPSARRVYVGWTPTRLELGCLGSAAGPVTQSTETVPTFPPISLIRLARACKLLPTVTFPSAEALRDALHQALSDLQDDIHRLGAYNPFWDQRYDGKVKGKPVPKKETDIHTTLLLLLSDWALARSVELIPESKTGAGNLDFCFVGHVDGQGPVSICAEVKKAHAGGVIRGLEVQLPAYMARKRSPYGVYIVLWFKGDWFDKPLSSVTKRIMKTWTEEYDALPSEGLDAFEYALATKAAVDPKLRNIRVFVIDVSKPAPASKI